MGKFQLAGIVAIICIMAEYKNRVLTVDCVILNSAYQVLLIKRGSEPFKGDWALPGGYMEWDETIEQAVLREVKEETGLSINKPRMIGIFDDPKRHPHQRITVGFLVHTSEIPEAGDDAEEVKFFPPKKLPADIAFDHRKIIEGLNLL